MANPIRIIKLIEGGTIIKQGEIFTLGFRLFDGQGDQIVPEPDHIVSIKIANKEGVIFTTDAVVVDDHIEFTVEGDLGYGSMRLEIKVTNGIDTLQKFPSDGWIDLLITPSLDDLGVGGIEKITADEMFADIAVINGVAAEALDVSLAAEDNSLIAIDVANAVRTDFDLVVAEAGSSNPEVVLARGGEVTLQARLDKTSTEIADSRLGADSVVRTSSGELIREVHTQQLESARQTTTLVNGVSVISGGVDALAETEIEGRTLTSLGNSNLEATKQYVVADKKTKVVVDGVTQSGVAKFTKGTTTVSTANFVGKVAGSTVANPHIARRLSKMALSTPSEPTGELDSYMYGFVSTLDGTSQTQLTLVTAGYYAQQLFSFDIIAEIERKLGVIPKATLAEKVQWVKDNLDMNTVVNWHGFGSSVGGNKAELRLWRVDTATWASAGMNHTNGTVTKLSYKLFNQVAQTDVWRMIDDNGFIHALAYAEPSDGVTASSISTDYIDLVVTLKATAQLNTRPTIIRVENFEGKVSGSVVENAHKLSLATLTTLGSPSSFTIEGSNNAYGNALSLNGVNLTFNSSLINGHIAQQLFSFNLIEAIERNIGKIPRSALADKVTWLKDNVSSIIANWYGFGSSVGGNKARFSWWNISTQMWSTSYLNTSITPTKIVRDNNLSIAIDSNGFVHYLAYAEASDGTTSSTINTDYIDLEIELRSTADFTRPKVALYEVDATSYAKILVDWNADAVVNRYPIVEGVQHLQGVGVVAEGENLLPPFTEWNVHANAKVISPYELELNAVGNASNKNTVSIEVIPNQIYNISVIKNGGRFILENWHTGVYLGIGLGDGVSFRQFTVPADIKRITIRYDDSAMTGTFTLSNPMLTLGNAPKPFVPRNPSYLYADVKLGSIGTAADRLYEQDGAKFVRKVVEKDVVLDGSLAWFFGSDGTGWKRTSISNIGNTPIQLSSIVTKFNGNGLKNIGSGVFGNVDEQVLYNTSAFHVTLADTDTGFGETFVPTANDVKRYFNGWKYSDGITWTSITGNGQTATAQVALDTKPTDYTPYKLSYVLATPQIVNVTDKVEGSLKVNGLTQVEVLSGVIRREKVVPVLTSGVYDINHLTRAPLKYKALKISKIHKNGIDDTSKWTFYTNSVNTNGAQRVAISASDYDPTAEYSVTYIALDKPTLTANPTNIKLLYANNMRSSLEDAVGKLQDNTTMLSVHEQAIIDLYVRVKALEASV